MEEQYFSEEHYILRDMVRDFAKTELAPIAQEIDNSGSFPEEPLKKMGKLWLVTTIIVYLIFAYLVSASSRILSNSSSS